MMISEARRKKIVELIDKEGIITLQRLTDTFGVSIYTIRRDLSILEEKNLIQKTHGGAMSLQKTKWIPSLEEGQKEALEEKKKIAAKAQDFIKSGDTIMLIGSIITILMLPYIKNKKLTIVTNSINVAKELCAFPNIETILIGGRIKNYKGNILGSRAIIDLQNYFFDKAFIPCAGVKSDTGISTSTIDSSDFLKAVIQRSRKNIIIADYRKIGIDTFAKVCPIENIDLLITDEKADQKELRQIAKKGIKLEISK